MQQAAVGFRPVDRRADECAVHGAFENQKYSLGGVERWTGCLACQRERVAREREENRQRCVANIAAARAQLTTTAARVPARFTGASFDNYQPTCDKAGRVLEVVKSYAAKWPELRAVGTSLILMGPPGTGKTHLAIAALRAVLAREGETAIYADFADLMLEVRSTYGGGNSEREGTVIQQYVRPSLLVLDEVGVTAGSDHEKATIFHVLNKRYLARRPTILVTNLAAPELKAFIGERVYDRLRENGGKGLAFDWDSYRDRV